MAKQLTERQKKERGLITAGEMGSRIEEIVPITVEEDENEPTEEIAAEEEVATVPPLVYESSEPIDTTVDPFKSRDIGFAVPEYRTLDPDKIRTFQDVKNILCLMNAYIPADSALYEPLKPWCKEEVRHITKPVPWQKKEVE